MKARKTIGVTDIKGGTHLELIEHDGHFILTANGDVLMTTRNRNSEEALARFGCHELGPGARVVIGGLGMGFTLRSALNILPSDARVIQVELVPEIVKWNRGALGEHAGKPLDDPRVEVVVGNVATFIEQTTERFDAILLDVDNGPSPLVSRGNTRLYSTRGLRTAYEALLPEGCLAVWSADEDRVFLERLESIGFSATLHRVTGRQLRGGPRHVVFTGRRD